LGTGSAAQVRIGNVPDGPDQFAGKLDDVRIYNTALTAADISTIYSASGSALTPPAAPSNLVLQ
jgi:hypothetical protein